MIPHPTPIKSYPRQFEAYLLTLTVRRSSPLVNPNQILCPRRQVGYQAQKKKEEQNKRYK